MLESYMICFFQSPISIQFSIFSSFVFVILYRFLLVYMNIQYLIKWDPDGNEFFILDKNNIITPVTRLSPQSKLLIPLFLEKGACINFNNVRNYFFLFFQLMPSVDNYIQLIHHPITKLENFPVPSPADHTNATVLLAFFTKIFITPSMCSKATEILHF